MPEGGKRLWLPGAFLFSRQPYLDSRRLLVHDTVKRVDQVLMSSTILLSSYILRTNSITNFTHNYYVHPPPIPH